LSDEDIKEWRDILIENNSIYDCFFIYHLYEDGDSIVQDDYNETLYTFNNFSKCNGDLILLQNDNVEPELAQAYIEITQNYVEQKYKPLVEAIIDYFSGLLEVKYSRIF
jgi:hypothetical protein